MFGEQACSSCSAPNRDGARFCACCGTSLTDVCPRCATEPRAGARFCDACGTALRPGESARPTPPASSERKQVTVLFADFADAGELAETLEPGEWKQVVARLKRLCTDAVERFGGTVEENAEEGVMATFGAPVAQEDHARRACHAALLLTGAACGLDPQINAKYGIELAVRVGLNSGDLPAGPPGHGGAGHPIGLAQRVEALAQPGSVYVSEHTARLVGPWFGLRDLGRFTVKGLTTTLGVHELTASLGCAGAVPRRVGPTTLVGRESERASLTVALDAAMEGQAQVLGLVGEAGSGTSRLCEELAVEAEKLGITVRRTAGVWNATTVPLLPIRALFRDYFGLAEDDSPSDVRDRVAARLLDLDPRLGDDLPVIFDFLEVGEAERPAPALGPEARRARLLDALRRLTRARSERDVLLLILEDLHWFDEESRAFLEAWLPSFTGSRTLIVTNYRPEFSAAWMNRSIFRKVPLQPLGRDAVAGMLRELMGNDPSLAQLTEGLADRAGGNPFFIEELVRGWVEDGTVAGGPGAYRLARTISQVVVPPSVHAVLVGRVDRLTTRQKTVLQAASTIGGVFGVAVLDRIIDLDPDELTEVLGQLCGAELIVPTDEGDYRFWNPLTQEVAYASLLASTRRAHHRAVADALVATAPGRVDELAVLIAGHYEAAEEPLRAAHLRMRAARLSMAGDPVRAESDTRRALAHLSAVVTSPETERLGVEARTMLLRLGARTGMDRGEVTALFDSAEPAAQRLGDPKLLALLGIARGTFSLWGDGEPRAAHARWVEARGHVATDDTELNAWLSTLIGWGACYHGRLADALDEVGRALTLCGDDSRVGIALTGHSLLDPARLVRARILGLTGELGQAGAEIARAIAGFEERPQPEAHSWALSVRTELAAFSGDPAAVDAARTGARAALALAVESGNPTAVVRARLAVGLGELLAGRPDVAATSLEQGVTHAREQRSAAPEEGNLLAALARAEMLRGDIVTAGRVAQQAIDVAERQGSDIVACLAHLTWAQILVRTAVADSDRELAADVIATGFDLAERTGALTYAAFLSEEEARLSGSVRSLASAAGDYESIGAFGQAARVRAELNTVLSAASGF